MKSFFFTFLIIFPLFIFSQSSINYGRTYSDTLPQNFKIEIPTIRNHIYSGTPTYYRNDKYKKSTYRFAHLSAYRISEHLSSGYVYSDWKSLEDYLNEILRKVIPKELSDNPFIHVYIFQDGRFNASMSPSGQMFFNIGTLSDLNSEAKIAAIFAHELAHYFKKHSLSYFIRDEYGAFTGGLLMENWAGNLYSKKQELEADSLAMIWLRGSGYNIAGLHRSFKIIENLEQKALNRSEDDWEIKDIAHATSKERLDALQRMFYKNKDVGGSFFLVDENKFKFFREESKSESLKFLMEDQMFYACMEKAFRFHIMNPDNKTYVYYLMESIRKICLKKYRYRENDTWNENFITNRYYDTLRVDGVRKKRKVNRSLFDRIDFKLLPITQEEARHIKAKFYWTEEPKFKTYSEAFEFYNILGKALGCNECILSYALSFKNTDLRNQHLNEYLSKDSIKFRDFAANLVNGEIMNISTNKKLLIIDEIFAFVKQGKEVSPIKESIKETDIIMKDIIDSLKATFPNRTILYLSDLRNYNLKDYKAFNDLRILSSYQLMDPSYLYLFKKYNVNEIEYLSSEFYESKSLNNNLEEYQDITSISYFELFNKTKSTRKFNTWLRSVRLIDNKKIEYKSYGGLDNVIKYKEPSYHRMINKFKSLILKKDKNP
jgi:hypothetical protein